MIDNASISPVQVLTPKFTVIAGVTRHRKQLDRKRNYFLFKRLFDVVFSFVFIVTVLSWLLPVLCLLIRLGSKGPVLFRQKRVGRGGRSFICYKLRTMVINEEADSRQASENDTRITALGWFLRKSNIDEFPQFFNVLKGEMSVIGPRPHMYADCNQFAAVMPGYKFRNLVKPGVTGLAQIKGYHGPTTTKNAMLMRYHWDSYYIHNIGLLLDAKIILYTIFQRFISVAAYAAQPFQPGKGHTKEILPN